MDPHRFDRLSKSVATRLTRRGLFAGLGAGALGAPLAAASLAADGAVTCVYDFDATIDVGPSSTIAQTNTAAGQLTLTVAANGAIDSGKLTMKDGTVWPAVGQATGRAISLRFSVPNTGAFIAVGVGRHDISTCPTAMAGPASGPLRKDAGSWNATVKTTAAATAAATTAVVTAPSGSAQPTAAAPVEQPTDEPTVTEGLTKDCQLQHCDASTLGLDPSTCSCSCASGLSSCVEGSCSDLSSDVNNCGVCGTVCQGIPNVATPVCTNGTCDVACLSGLVTCGPDSCTDLSSDTDNCGTCGVVCPGIPNDADPACTGGICGFTCLRGLVTCSLDAVCKTFLDRDNGHCGSCDNACGGGTPTCVNSACTCTLQCSAGMTPNADCTACVNCSTDIQTDQQNCGACGNVCPTFSPVCQGGQCVAPAKA